MNVRLANRGTTLIAGISGELDHHTAEYVRQKIESEMIKATTKNIVLDFSKLGFMDSSGIGVIMGRYKSIQMLNGKMAIAGANSQIKRILEMSGIMKVIPLYDSIDTAVKMM